jgi:ribonuclease HI
MKLVAWYTREALRIFSDSQAAPKALQHARTSPLVQQCQKALNGISTWHAVGFYWVPAHAGVHGNKISGKLARDGSVQKFVGCEPVWESLGRI